jgi:hypothetical protein
MTETSRVAAPPSTPAPLRLAPSPARIAGKVQGSAEARGQVRARQVNNATGGQSPFPASPI